MRGIVGIPCGCKGPYWEINKSTGCWNWLYSRQPRRNGSGYGWKFYDGRMWLAHRWVWLAHHGSVPEPYKFDLHHKCDNLLCVNPNHLAVVTHAKNVQLGRKAKLSPEKIKEIRSTYKFGVRGSGATVLAHNFGVSKPIILAIVKNRIWRNV